MKDFNLFGISNHSIAPPNPYRLRTKRISLRLFDRDLEFYFKKNIFNKMNDQSFIKKNQRH
jgi:hypothetical protein